jgi:hypothetical protein
VFKNFPFNSLCCGILARIVSAVFSRHVYAHLRIRLLLLTSHTVKRSHTHTYAKASVRALKLPFTGRNLLCAVVRNAPNKMGNGN